ncbi:TPA: hypothetical protein U1B91_000785 [Streptococcus suis]|uniref:hypothetical protein n=1 Tax=Streptococcus suis TaxID=1307 RepID=UPI00209C51B4|nr:hypothetical protein [Streptococcus suis]MCO8204734.1 hypothetical protein [Streptococcus suis]HEM3454409.1 hypothetical protein [Streptococcus suis]HEM3587520.1 hypothetical protein [Streptococcus suis]
MDLADLMNSLNQYSPQTNQIMEAMAGALRPTGLILIGIFFLIELVERTSELKLEGGTMTPRLFGEIAFYYLIAFLLVWQFDIVLDATLELGNALQKIADKVVPAKDVDTIVNLDGVKGAFMKGVMKAIGSFTHYISGIVVKVIMMLRYYQIYIAGVLGPIIVAFFVNRSLRSIAVNFLKLIAAYALQGLVLLVVIRLYPYIVTDSILAISNMGEFESFLPSFTSIARGIIFIMLVVGSGRYSKSLMGVS